MGVPFEHDDKSRFFLGPVEQDDKSRKTLRPVKHACLIFRYLKLVQSLISNGISVKRLVTATAILFLLSNSKKEAQNKPGTFFEPEKKAACP